MARPALRSKRELCWFPDADHGRRSLSQPLSESFWNCLSGRNGLRSGSSADEQLRIFTQARTNGQSPLKALSAVIDWLIQETIRSDHKVDIPVRLMPLSGVRRIADLRLCYGSAKMQHRPRFHVAAESVASKPKRACSSMPRAIPHLTPAFRVRQGKRSPYVSMRSHVRQ